MATVIPSIYEAMQRQSLYETNLFPSLNTRGISNLQTQNKITQIAYFVKKQTELAKQQSEEVIERQRDEKYKELVSLTNLYGTVKNLQPIRKKAEKTYKFALPNLIGFPVTGTSTSLTGMVPPIASALGIPQKSVSRVLTEPAFDGVSVIEIKDFYNFKVKVYLNKFTHTGL